MPETEEIISPEAAPEQAETPVATEPTEAESAEPSEEPKKVLPRGVQKKINKLTRRNYELLDQNNQLLSRLEAIEQKLEGKKPEEPKSQPAPKPKQDDFASYEAFVEAMVDWKADEKIAARLAAERERESTQSLEAERREIFDAYNSRVKEARAKYDDFDEVLSQNFSIMPGQEKTFESVTLTIYELENGPDVAYYLAQHPAERKELLSLSPNRAAAQLGRISDKLATSKEEEPEEEIEGEEPEEDSEEELRAPEKKAAPAPKPITPVKKVAPTATGLDDDLPIDEWLKRREKQLAAKKK
jgi:hypothetical protein